MSRLRLGSLLPRHRNRLAEILAATGVFSAGEVEVALGLFDQTFPEEHGRKVEKGASGSAASSSLAPASPDYEFIGGFDADDTLVAYACYGPTSGTDGTFDLYWIAVDPAMQSAGGGSALLDEVERRLRQRAGRLLVVETSSRGPYEPTRRFYDARGYTSAARVADFYAPGDDRMIYTKRLTPKATSADRPPSTH